MPEIATKCNSNHKKHRYELVEEPKKQVNRTFIDEKLAIKVIMDFGTTMTHNFRKRLRFTQFDVILTKQQSVLTKIMSSFEGENMQTQYKALSYRIDLYFHRDRESERENLGVTVDNIVTSKLVKTKTNSKYLIEYFDKTIRPIVLRTPKMSGYGGYVKVEVKERKNKLLSFSIDDKKLSEKYKVIWTKIEDLKSIKLNTLPVYGYSCIKSKIRRFGDKAYTDVRGLNVLEDDIECEYFTVISIDSFLVYDKKYYMQVYLDNCAYEIVNKQMADYLDENLIED